MARAFRPEAAGGVTARLDRHEVAVLRGLVEDVVTLVTPGTRDNPVTARLFPDPSFDPVESDKVRELIHDDLREAKLDAARALLASLPDDGRVTLDRETAEQWLTALNDVRLALGTALGVTEDDDEEPADAGSHTYHWASFLMETLVDALSVGGVHR